MLILALGDFVLILINLRLGLNPWFHLLSFTDNFVRLWLLKDHGTLLLDKSIEKYVDYSPKFYGGQKALV